MLYQLIEKLLIDAEHIQVNFHKLKMSSIDKIAAMKKGSDYVFDKLTHVEGYFDGLESSARSLEQKLEGFQAVDNSYAAVNIDLSLNYTLYAPSNAGSDGEEMQHEDDEYADSDAKIIED
jgi:hypothetical protein